MSNAPITRKGYFELRRNGILISNHTSEVEAYSNAQEGDEIIGPRWQVGYRKPFPGVISGQSGPVGTPPPPPPRTGIIWRLNWQGGAYPVLTDPTGPDTTPNDWPVDRGAAHDGIKLRHRGENQYATESPDRDHYVLQNTDPIPLNGMPYAARLTIHPPGTTDYSVMGGKARIDQDNFWWTRSNLGGNSYRQTYWFGMGVWVDSDHVEETTSSNSGEQTHVMQIHTQNGPPNLALYMKGNGSGSIWQIRRNQFTVDTTSVFDTHNTSWDILPAHYGVWNYFVFETNIDNRTSGGSPLCRCWHSYGDHMSVTSTTLVLDDSSTPWGSNHFASQDWASWDLDYYKGNWHDGGYAGSIFTPMSIGSGGGWLGDNTSDYTSVHPIQAVL